VSNYYSKTFPQRLPDWANTPVEPLHHLLLIQYTGLQSYKYTATYNFCEQRLIDYLFSFSSTPTKTSNKRKWINNFCPNNEHSYYSWILNGQVAGGFLLCSEIKFHNSIFFFRGPFSTPLPRQWMCFTNANHFGIFSFNDWPYNWVNYK